MSRIGKQHIAVPAGVEVSLNGDVVLVKGPKGALTQKVHKSMSIITEKDTIRVERPSDEREHRALHGLTRSLVANMVKGVVDGYEKILDLVGVGYRVQQSGNGISLSVMLSHSVEIEPPEGVTLEVEGNNRVIVKGADKQAVGQIAAKIRSVRPPNAYTGKGIRYSDENVRIKPGKSARRAEV